MIRDLSYLDRRPIVVAIAGSEGAGKTTFYHSHLADSALRFVNADVLAVELGLTANEAADAIRNALPMRRESFVFETVLSDPAGDEVAQLRGLADQGYEVVVIFIRIAGPEVSVVRRAMRASQRSHDLPDERLLAQFDRTRANLQRAIEQLPRIIIFDNSDLSHPYRHVATYHHGEVTECESGPGKTGAHETR